MYLEPLCSVGPCPLSTLAVPRLEFHLWVRPLPMPGYTRGPSGEYCQAWEDEDTRVGCARV